MPWTIQKYNGWEREFRKEVQKLKFYAVRPFSSSTWLNPEIQWITRPMLRHISGPWQYLVLVIFYSHMQEWATPYWPQRKNSAGVANHRKGLLGGAKRAVIKRIHLFWLSEILRHFFLDVWNGRMVTIKWRSRCSFTHPRPSTSIQ